MTDNENDLPEPDALEPLRARLDQAEARLMRLEQQTTVIPSIFGGVNPLTLPLPPDAGEAIGQHHNVMIWLESRVKKLEKQALDILAKLGFADYQARIAKASDNRDKRLADLEQWRAEIQNLMRGE
jgi:hypothetical protein